MFHRLSARGLKEKNGCYCAWTEKTSWPRDLGGFIDGIGTTTALAGLSIDRRLPFRVTVVWVGPERKRKSGISLSLETIDGKLAP